jgi:hypothetical protein
LCRCAARDCRTGICNSRLRQYLYFCSSGAAPATGPAQPEIAGRASATAGLRQYSSSSVFVRAAASVFVLLYQRTRAGRTCRYRNIQVYSVYLLYWFTRFTCFTGLLGLLALLVRTRAGRTCRSRSSQRLRRRSRSNRLRTSVCAHRRIHRYRVLCQAEARLYFSGSTPRRACCVSICTHAPAAASVFVLLY